VSKHANDSLAVGATLSNTAVANSADLVVSLANSNAVTLTVGNLQSSSGATVVAQNASTITGSIADVGGAGGGKTWGVKNTDANAITPVVYCGGIVNVYGLASANAITTPINLGTIHKNALFANSALSIQNTAPDTSGYTEKLNASVGSPTGNATHNSGSISLLAPQVTDTSITVSLNGTDTAGSKTGTVTITLTSDGTGTSGLGTTALASQVITVNGVVYSGDGVWDVNANGNWSAPGNWTTLGGVPGLDGSFLTTDTATFGAAATSVSPQVSLNGDSPHVTAITFDNATRSYSIVQGAGAGKLNLTGGAGTSTITLTSGSHAINVETVLKSNLTVGGGGNLTVGGAITEESGPRTLTKTDGGTLTLTGASTYAGATAVNGGTLEVNGSLAGGGAAVTVASGATLGGTGTVSRAVSVDVGGFLAPALSGIGTQTVASATIPGTLAMNMDDSGAGTGQTDGLIVSGNLNATGGTLALGIVGTLNDASYTLVTFGSLTGTFTVTGLPSNYRVVYEADSIKLRKIAGGSVIIFR
jgi:autotransporter-associated beta strand protein